MSYTNVEISHGPFLSSYDTLIISIAKLNDVKIALPLILHVAGLEENRNDFVELQQTPPERLSELFEEKYKVKSIQKPELRIISTDTHLFLALSHLHFPDRYLRLVDTLRQFNFYGTVLRADVKAEPEILRQLVDRTFSASDRMNRVNEAWFIKENHFYDQISKREVLVMVSIILNKEVLDPNNDADNEQDGYIPELKINVSSADVDTYISEEGLHLYLAQLLEMPVEEAKQIHQRTHSRLFGS